MKNLIFFDTREDLCEITGLPMEDHCRALWDAGFNLDDWDFGVASTDELSEEGWWQNEQDCHYYEYWLLSNMERHCVGFEHTEYNGMHYYLVYHS